MFNKLAEVYVFFPLLKSGRKSSIRRVFGDIGVEGGIFRVFDGVGEGAKVGVPPTSPLFPRLSGSIRSLGHLSKSRAVDVLRILLRRVGVPSPEDYSGHSARRGGYVDRIHVPLRFVQIQGHWAPGSATSDQDYSVHSVPLRLQYF